MLPDVSITITTSLGPIVIMASSAGAVTVTVGALKSSLSVIFLTTSVAKPIESKAIAFNITMSPSIPLSS